MESIDCLVVGAGVIGLAAARALAQAGREVVVVDGADSIGTETSSRNSEVVHAGLYYPPDSLMARACVEGRHRLLAYCEARNVPFEKCGKLIVATEAGEEVALDDIRQNAEASGAGLLRYLSRAEAIALEPELHCTAALFSPETAIVDSHHYMSCLRADAEAAGASFAFRTRVQGGAIGEERIEVTIATPEPTRFRCNLLVNAAGLHAPAVATSLGMSRSVIPQPYYAKGHYFALSGRCPFSRLIYPVPVPGGLGIHLTFDLGRRAKFGPDVQWTNTIDYSFEAGDREQSFYDAVRRYYPGLRNGALTPDYCGIRPKLAPAGAPRQDFMVQGPQDHGISGLLNYFGIESPGLTSSLVLGDLAVEALLGSGRITHT
jgi:L-2-hydroxyglutarate oxidase LhgO